MRLSQPRLEPTPMLTPLVTLNNSPSTARAAWVSRTIHDAVLHVLCDDDANVLGSSIAAELAAVIDAADTEERLVGTGDGVDGIIGGGAGSAGSGGCSRRIGGCGC